LLPRCTAVILIHLLVGLPPCMAEGPAPSSPFPRQARSLAEQSRIRSCGLLKLPVDLSISPLGVDSPGAPLTLELTAHARILIDDLTLTVTTSPHVTIIGPTPAWRGQLDPDHSQTLYLQVISPGVSGAVELVAKREEGKARLLTKVIRRVGPPLPQLKQSYRTFVASDGVRRLNLGGVIRVP